MIFLVSAKAHGNGVFGPSTEAKKPEGGLIHSVSSSVHIEINRQRVPLFLNRQVSAFVSAPLHKFVLLLNGPYPAGR